MALVATATLIEACKDPNAMKGCEIIKTSVAGKQMSSNPAILKQLMSSIEKIGCTGPGLKSGDKGTFKQGISE